MQGARHFVSRLLVPIPSTPCRAHQEGENASPQEEGQPRHQATGAWLTFDLIRSLRSLHRSSQWAAAGERSRAASARSFPTCSQPGAGPPSGGRERPERRTSAGAT